MKKQVEKLLSQKGYGPILSAIDKSKRDLKQHGYTRSEIEETLFDMFGKNDTIITKKIRS